MKVEQRKVLTYQTEGDGKNGPEEQLSSERCKYQPTWPYRKGYHQAAMSMQPYRG